MIVLYKKDWAWCYNTPGGRMECPPFVQTLGDIETYFSGHEYEFLKPPSKKALKRASKVEFADYEKKPLETENKPKVFSKKGRRHIYYIAQYTLDGKLIAKYLSTKAAAEKTGITENSIRKMFCNGSNRTNGFL